MFRRAVTNNFFHTVCAAFSLTHVIRCGIDINHNNTWEAIELIPLLSCILCTGLAVYSNYVVYQDVVYQELRFRAEMRNQQRELAEVTRLQEAFDSLGKAEQEELVSTQLAEKDAINNISLKYICPISRCLMADPIILKVKNRDGSIADEIYDRSSIKLHLLASTGTVSISPLTRRPLVKTTIYELPSQQAEEYRNHMNLLKEKLNREHYPKM